MLRFDRLACFTKSLRVPFSLRPSRSASGVVTAFLALLWLFGVAGSVSAQTSTTTTLSVTATNGSTVTTVDTGTVVVLTASVVKSGGGGVTLGTVNFCDATAAHCEDGHLLGSAQVTSKGTAIFKFRPAPGEHSYQAFFHGTTHGTTLLAASVSGEQNLTVTGGPYATTTSIAQSGSAGDNTLTATVSSSNLAALLPTGAVDFLDTTNSNYGLGSAPLVSGTSLLSYTALTSVGTGAGTQPMWSVTADFNQDGIPDIAVIDFNNPNIYTADSAINIYFGNADGTFTQQATLDTSVTAAKAIVAADLNGDGYPDLVVSVDGALNVFLNNGSGGFGSPATYNLSYTDFAGNYANDDPAAIAVGDVNNDGHLDVVFPFGSYDGASTSSSTGPTTIGVPPGVVGVALGNGDGTLQFNGTAPYVPVYGTFNSNPSSIVLADLTGNGNLDIITGSGVDNYLSVLAGNGDGTFQYANSSTYFTTQPAGSDKIVVADFNGDGKPDLAFNTSTGPWVSIMIGNGDRTFQIPTYGNGYLTTTYVAGSLPYGMVTADLNGDGIPDLATANILDNTVTVMLGNGDGTFQAPHFFADGSTSSQTALTFPAGNGPNSIQAANFSGNGIPSLAVVDENGNSVSTLAGTLSTTATATLTGVSPMGAGSTTHAVEASYAGDAYYSASASATTSLTAQPVMTTLALVSNTSALTVGGQVTLTATISPGSVQGHSASGTVTFYMNGNSIGTATPSNGVAVLTPHLDVVQTDTFTASYAGDSNFVGSSSTALVQVGVQKAATTLTLGVCNYTTTWICPATISTYGQVMELTATLAPYSVTGGGSSDGETVSFYNKGAVIGTGTLTSGIATLDLAQPAAGSYSFTASYGGDASLVASSSSPADPMTVQMVTPSVTLGVFPVSTNTYGQPVFLTATFNTYPFNVTGETVTFYNGTSVVGTATFGSQSGPAMLTLNNLPVGSYSFKATYPGDSNYFSDATTTTALSVQKLPTVLTVNSGAPGTVIYGTPITLQASIEPHNVSGGNTTNGEAITFYQNGTAVGTGTLTNGAAMFTVNVPPVGNDSFTAGYAGDTSFGNSTTSQADVFTVERASTTMGIITSAPHGYVGSGQPITLTATLSTYPLTGTGTNGETVTFFSGATSLGTGTLSNGVATFSLPNGLAEGNYTFSASYPGDAIFNGSTTSPDAGLIVLQSTSLTVTTNPAHYGGVDQPVSITVTLSPYAIAGDNTNGQMVYINNGSSQLGNAALSNGVATYSLPNGLPQGSYSFNAIYDGDGILAGSASPPVTFAVATLENFVVNNQGDDPGAAGNCTPLSSTTSNTIDGACSLRDALLAATNAPESANIYFDVNSFIGPTTIALTNGTLTVPSNTTITGPTFYDVESRLNLVTVDGGGTSQYQTSSTVFTVTGTSTAISNLTISGGWTPWSYPTPVNGGGILNSGALTLTNCTVQNNGTFYSGGGIYNTGTLTVVGSTISGNSAATNAIGDGGGIDNGGGTLTVINSTIANNMTPSGWGGGIAVDAGTATITNSTISGNSANGGGGGISTVVPDINGVTSNGGAVTLANTVVSGNSDFLSDIDDGSVPYTDKGGNIVGFLNRTAPAVNNPNLLTLGPLGSYGGPTQTMLPLPGSSAICAGTAGNSPSQWEPMPAKIVTDQRGFLNYNLNYGGLGRDPAGAPLPSFCVDAGAVQTNYQQVQFYQTGYTGLAGGAVTPLVMIAVQENLADRGAVPVTLSYSGSGTVSGNTATAVEGAGATFPALSVDTGGSGTLSTKIIIGGTSYIQASTSLNILAAPQIAPGSESVSAVVGAPLSQIFIVSGGSGNFQLTSSGTLSAGLTLTPSGLSTGASWTLSGTPSQSGSFNFTLTATDVANSIVAISQSYTVTVAPSTTTILSASPASSAPLGQTVTLTATVSSPTANGTVSFFDGGNSLGSAGLSGGSPNTAALALDASTLGVPLAFGTHNFTSQFSGDATDAASASNTIPYNITAPNLVVNTTSDDDGLFTCTALESTTSNTTDGNNGGGPGQCTLRDALNTASALGAGSIYFDTAVFTASNLDGNSAANTIAPNIAANGSLNIWPNTTIQGLTSGGGATLTNLVTVDGGGPSVANNGTIFVVDGTGTAISNLNMNNGYASNGGSGGAITNTASITVSGSKFTGNQATGSGGAIFNAFGGTVTVVNSTFSSNSTTGGNGGAIDNANFYGCGTTTVTNSTFSQNTAANGGSAYGGAINNDGDGPCTLTVNSSTIVGNSTDNSNPSDGYGGGGGGIYSQFLLYLANNVITGNTISGSGEDDLDDNFWGSNYWGGNDLTLGNNIINGNLIGVWNGFTENGTSVILAPLANYGGPTQTMIPLPGSAAICAGLASSIAAGFTTDQRGYPNTNTTYAGYSAGSPCVDSGAAQGNYALAFTTEPPSSVAGGVAISPSPVVQLTESGVPAAAASNSVSMTDSASLLTGTTTSNLSSGSATFSNLVIPSAVSNDLLTATLALNSTLNLAVQASVGVSAIAAQPAALLSSTSLSFASEPIGYSTAAQNVTLTNTGSSALALTSIRIAGADSASFASSNTCGASLAAGSSCRIGVRFAPTVTGLLSPTITLIDNAGDSPQSIALNGTGLAVPAASLTLSAASISFASEPIGYSTAAQNVSVTNSSSVTLYFRSITLAGANPASFASSNTCGTSLAAGATCKIGVRFDPAITGALAATITLTDNAGDSPQSITLSGTGLTVPVASLTLSTNNLSFADEPIGYSSTPQNVTVTNSGAGTIYFQSITLAGISSTSFASSNTCSTSLVTGASCRIGIRFAPTVVGGLSATITLIDNAGDSPEIITLTGTGIAVPTTSLMLSTNNLSFGSEPIGSSTAAQNVNVTNSGAGTIYFQSIVLAGSNPTSFASSNTCGTSLAAGATCRIGVRFVPTVTGALSATITLSDNAGDSPQSIALNGTGQ